MTDKNTKWYVSLVLFIVALISVTLWPIGITYSLLTHPKGFFAHLLRIALSLDQSGNACMGVLFNNIMKQKGQGSRFGNIDETVSSALGKNQQAESLTWFGRQVVAFLDWLDPNHSLDSIELNP